MLSKVFPNFSFVGFYDKREKDDKNIHIGEYVSADVFPCGTIALGKGQCGLCVSEKKTMIAKDVSKLANYIACDADT